jgi:hypothetical protein
MAQDQISFHPEVSCVPRDVSNSKLQPESEKDAIQIPNVCSLPGTKGLPCGLQLQKALVFFFMVYLPCEPGQ